MTTATRLLMMSARGGFVPTPAGPILDGTSPSMAYAVDRQLLSSYAGNLVDQVSGAASVLYDQSGNGRNFAQATALSRPAVQVKRGKPALVGAGTHSMQGPLISAVYGGTDTWVTMVVEPAVVTRGPNSGTMGHQVLGDTAEGGDIIFHQNGYSHVRSTQFDGAYKHTPVTRFYAGNIGVVQFRKDATKLYCRVNLMPEQEVLCGALTAIAYNLILFGAANDKFNGNVWAMAGYRDADVPDLAKREAIVTRLMQEYGVPFPPTGVGYPTAANTGTVGPLTEVIGNQLISVDGQIVENLDITGNLRITAKDVVVRNCRIRANDFYCVIVQGTGCRIEDCEISGELSTIGITAISVQAANCTVIRCNIHHAGNYMQFTGNGHVFRDNYGHTVYDVSPDPHYDGFECNGGSDNVLIEHNTIYVEANQTGCIQLNNEFGGISNITVNDNFLVGSGYNIYATDTGASGLPVSNIMLSNNILGRGEYGFFYFNTGVTTLGNIDLASGFVIR